MIGRRRALVSPGLAIVLLFLANCATVRDESVLTPRQAVERAADSAPAGVHAIFEMPVLAAGRDNGRIFLNSERDYRDQRNLSLSIGPQAAAGLTRRHGAPPDVFFPGKRVRVTGAAARVRINFFSQGRLTDLYYYQTHVAIQSADQITVLGSSSRRPRPQS